AHGFLRRCSLRWPPFWPQRVTDATESECPGCSDGSRLCGAALHAAPRPGQESNKKPPRGGLFQLTSASQESVRVGPDFLLGEVHQDGEDDQEHEDLKTELLARFHLRFRRPRQEGGDVVGILRNRRRRAVVEGHLAVRERL